MGMKNMIKGTIEFLLDRIVIKYNTGEKMVYKLSQTLSIIQGSEYIVRGGQTYIKM